MPPLRGFSRTTQVTDTRQRRAAAARRRRRKRTDTRSQRAAAARRRRRDRKRERRRQTFAERREERAREARERRQTPTFIPPEEESEDGEGGGRRQRGNYVVQPGDSAAAIAAKVYSDPRLYIELLEQGIVGRVTPGQVLNLPSEAELRARSRRALGDPGTPSEPHTPTSLRSRPSITPGNLPTQMGDLDAAIAAAQPRRLGEITDAQRGGEPSGGVRFGAESARRREEFLSSPLVTRTRFGITGPIRDEMTRVHTGGPPTDTREQRAAAATERRQQSLETQRLEEQARSIELGGRINDPAFMTMAELQEARNLAPDVRFEGFEAEDSLKRAKIREALGGDFELSTPFGGSALVELLRNRGIDVPQDATMAEIGQIVEQIATDPSVEPLTTRWASALERAGLIEEIEPFVNPNVGSAFGGGGGFFNYGFGGGGGGRGRSNVSAATMGLVNWRISV